MSDIKVTWIDRFREPKCAPNPAHPDGIDVDLRTNKIRTGCAVELPYPAKRCGLYVVDCLKCGYRAAITTAGRPDDPRKVTLPCKLN